MEIRYHAAMFRFSLGSFISLEVSVKALLQRRKWIWLYQIWYLHFKQQNGQFMTHAKEELIEYPREAIKKLVRPGMTWGSSGERGSKKHRSPSEPLFQDATHSGKRVLGKQISLWACALTLLEREPGTLLKFVAGINYFLCHKSQQCALWRVNQCYINISSVSKGT